MVKLIGFSRQDEARIARLLSKLPSEHTSHITSVEAGAAVMGEPAYHSGGGRVVATPVGLGCDDDYLASVLVHENAHAAYGHDEGRPCGAQADYLDSIGRNDAAEHVRGYSRDQHHREPGSSTPVYADAPAPQPAEASTPQAETTAAEPEHEPSGWCNGPGRHGAKRFWI